MGSSRRPPPESTQASKFRDAARELGCDDSEEVFDEALKKVARHKPKDDKTKPPKPKSE